jgi:hypothetical protein
MQEHLQNLMSEGYMTVAELVTFHTLIILPSPILAGGICCGMCSILLAEILCAITLISPLFAIVHWLGPASLDPSGILHMAAFMTMCEAYMGIEAHLHLWNYFFHGQR